MPDDTARFTDRARDYALARPTYPPEVMTLMAEEMGFEPCNVVVDVGSGTGILSELFLRHGNTVYAVEPNVAMRRTAEDRLRGYPGFRSIDGRAEATTLAAAVADVVVVGQAFHWFDAPATAREFSRILRPPGWVVILWNERRLGGTAFLEAYEHFIERWSVDYETVRHRYDIAPGLRTLFGDAGYGETSFDYVQVLDRAGLRARVCSSSYVPGPDHQDRKPMLEDLNRVFDQHHERGMIRIEYDTRVYYGRVLV